MANPFLPRSYFQPVVLLSSEERGSSTRLCGDAIKVALCLAVRRRNSTRRRGPTLSCSERPWLVAARQSRTVWSSSCPHSTLRKRECPPRSDEPRGRGSSRQSFSSSVAPPVGGHSCAAYDGR